MLTQGVDKSHWSGKTDFHLMKSRGVKFNIAKMSDFYYNTKQPFIDSRWNETYTACREVGILIGGYHWLQPGVDPTVQAKWYLDQYFKTPTDIPPVVDFEDGKYSTVEDYLWRLRTWLEKVELETGRVPIIYTGNGFMAPFIASGQVAWMARYPLWLAHYTTTPVTPYPWDKWTFWQYSESGDGVFYGTESLHLDMDYFNGTESELRLFCMIEEQEPVKRKWWIYRLLEHWMR